MACDNNCKIRLEKGIISCFIGRSVVRRVCNCTAGLKLPRGWDLGLFLLFFFFSSVYPLNNFVLLFVCPHQLWSWSVLTSPAQRLRCRGALGWIYSVDLFWCLSFDRSQARSVWRRLGMQHCYLYSTQAWGSTARGEESVISEHWECQTPLSSASCSRKRLWDVRWV